MDEKAIIERIEELRSLVQKLEFQVSTLGEAIDYENFPMQSLILSMDWNRDQLDIAHSIFETWDKKLNAGEPMRYGEFESAFEENLGIGYQGVKSVILAFYEDHRWTNVCEAYVATDAGSTAELQSIRRQIS